MILEKNFAKMRKQWMKGAGAILKDLRSFNKAKNDREGSLSLIQPRKPTFLPLLHPLQQLLHLLLRASWEQGALLHHPVFWEALHLHRVFSRES